MPAPMAWSYTSLSDFKNCPRRFHEERVLKNYRQDATEAMTWGRSVHTAFELRQRDNTPLPDDLASHEPFMQRLDRIPGKLFVEQRIALNMKLEPCGFFDKDVFMRSVIDWVKVDLDHKPYPMATIVDYKTGKVNPKWEQLMLYAIWVFHRFGGKMDVKLAQCMFYWTQQPDTVSKKVWGFGELDMLWKKFTPDLRQYLEAFKGDVWQPRKSGLCRGWCPVTTCEFNEPKRA